jgi:hypothetical protein
MPNVRCGRVPALPAALQATGDLSPLTIPCGQRSDEFRPRQLSISESQPQSRTFDAMHTTGGDA